MMLMKPRWLALPALALALSFAALEACAPAIPQPPAGFHDADEEPKTVPFRPPPGRAEIVTPRPKDLKLPVWIDGDWIWRGRRWVWIPGAWQEMKPGQTYAPGVTVQMNDGRLAYFAGAWKSGPPKLFPSSDAGPAEGGDAGPSDAAPAEVGLFDGKDAAPPIDSGALAADAASP